MLKKLFVGLVPAVIITTTGLCVLPAQSASTTTVISTPRQFCEYFSQRPYNTQAFEECSTYSDEVGAPFVTDRIFSLSEDEDITLKDMNFTYDMIRSPFRLLWGGKLTIDGGTYRTTHTCFFDLDYDVETGATSYDGLTIISGDFIAENKYNDQAQSPICLAPGMQISNEEAEPWLSRALGPNSYFTEYGTEKKIELETELIDNIRGYGKGRDEMTRIKEFNSSKISVREILPEVRKAPVEEEIPEEDEPQIEEEPEETEEISEEKIDTVLPKAPNTGVGKM